MNPLDLVAANIGVVLFGLLSSATWGAGDFCGGLATRRSTVFAVLVTSQIVGIIFLIALAVVFGEPFPPLGDMLWGAAAGLAGAIGLAALYASLAQGQMGINAPVIAVLAGAIPVIYGIRTEGAPNSLKLIGFGLALIAVWLISRPATTAKEPPRGLGLAVLSGITLGGFFILIGQTQSDAVFWPLTAARAVSIPIMTIVALVSRQPLRPSREVLRLVILTGVFDALGNAFFVLAEQSGRFDVATVLSSLYPVSTTILAFLILKERMGRLQSAGIVLAFIAIILIVL